MLDYNSMINLFHIFIVAPLLWAVGTNRFPQEYISIFVVLAIIVLIFHTYRLYTRQMAQ